MPVDERARLHPVRRLEETLGPEATASLMALESHVSFTMAGTVVSLGGIAVALAGLG